MIYEKRQAATFIKKEDMPVKKLQRAEEKERESKAISVVVPPELHISTAKPFRFSGRSYRKKTASKRSLLIASIIVFCMFAVDARLMGGRIKSEITDVARNGVSRALENIAENTTGRESTLYARLLSDRSDEIFADEAVVLQEQSSVEAEDHKDTSRIVAVSGNTSKSFVDGEVFYPITKLDLSADSLYSLTNATSFAPDLKKLSQMAPKALENIRITDNPLVLIVHTHAEECYTEYTDMYPQSEATRSGDTEKNVVRVGKEIKNTLEDFGITSVHCTKMHDSESFINAYSGSATSVRQYLKQYPSIKVVVDVHRDAIIRDDGESIKAAAQIAGQEYAQLMFVVGTNELGHNHPGWQDNLTLALAVQKNIDSTYPSLCRSINLRDVPFNQQLSSGYLLLEVGTCANTLDEALRSARAFGENLARTLANAQ